MLGELARREYTDPTSVTQRRVEFGRLYIELLRSKDLVRTDISISEPLSPEKVQEVHTIFIQLFDHLIDAVKERIQKEVGS